MDIETAQVLREVFAQVDRITAHHSPEARPSEAYTGARARVLQIAAGGAQPSGEPNSSEPQVGTTGETGDVGEAPAVGTTGDAEGTVTQDGDSVAG